MSILVMALLEIAVLDMSSYIGCLGIGVMDVVALDWGVHNLAICVVV
jgi:hypothetical protein